MDPMVSAGEITDIALDGVKRFAPGSTLYIRPMFYLDGSLDVLMPDPESTRFVLTLFEAPMPSGNGFACCPSSFRRPTPETAPTDAKASCHYPNSTRAVVEARRRDIGRASCRERWCQYVLNAVAARSLKK